MTLCSSDSSSPQSTSFVSVTHMNTLQGPFYSSYTVHSHEVSRALCPLCGAVTTAATREVTDGSGSRMAVGWNFAGTGNDDGPEIWLQPWLCSSPLSAGAPRLAPERAPDRSLPTSS